MKTMIKLVLVVFAMSLVICAKAQDWKILAVNTNTGVINYPITAYDMTTGSVCSVQNGRRYFWTSATNVLLTANLTSGQVVNYAILRNTSGGAITAIGPGGWK